MDTFKSIVEALAREDPEGIVDYEPDYSELTPGAGAIEGCRFCKQRWYGPTQDWGHDSTCAWARARIKLGLPLTSLTYSR